MSGEPGSATSAEPLSQGFDFDLDGGSGQMDCPRCKARVSERFYGPCSTCRDELVALAGQRAAAGEATPALATEFIPKVNVVANHVATKD